MWVAEPRCDVQLEVLAVLNDMVSHTDVLHIVLQIQHEITLGSLQKTIFVSYVHIVAE